MRFKLDVLDTIETKVVYDNKLIYLKQYSEQRSKT